MAGDLTIREITKPVVFDVKAILNGSTVTATATTAFLMSEFGVDPPAMGNLFTVGDNTVVTITLVASE
jgi:polyisoprenoid-binding protein YceI